MGKEQEGVVLETFDDLANVKASRHTDCENCGACPGNQALVLTARNPVGARRGQRVIFEIEQTSMLKSALVVYALPLAWAFLGALAGWRLGEKLSFPETSAFQIAGGALAFLLAIFYVRYYDRKARAKKDMQPVITRIVSN